MATSEKFCLRWNDFEKNIGVAFRDIREEKDFFDCTLSCGAKQIQAHKLILSACSPFFSSILKQNPHQHPLIYLKDIAFNDLQSVLNFMYHGEVNVAQEELNTFLTVAEDLQVKGLTQNSQASHDSVRKSPSLPKKGSQPLKQTLASTISVSSSTTTTTTAAAANIPSKALPPYNDYQLDEIQEVLPVVKTEPYTSASFIDQSTQNTVSITREEETLDNMMREEGNMTVSNIREVGSIDNSYVDDEYGYGYGDYEGQVFDNTELGTGKHLLEVLANHRPNK